MRLQAADALSTIPAAGVDSTELEYKSSFMVETGMKRKTNEMKSVVTSQIPKKMLLSENPDEYERAYPGFLSSLSLILSMPSLNDLTKWIKHQSV